MLSPRPELEQYQEYRPGLSIEEIERRYGFKEVVKLASNENFLGSSPAALAAYKKAAQKIYRYPESQSIDLRRTISDRYKIGIENVIVGNGSDEIIELLAKAFLSRGDQVLLSETTFTEYKISANLMGAEVKTVPMKTMKYDLQGMLDNIDSNTKIIFIANPNNPTGTYCTKSEIKNFLANLPEHVLPVIDEAYNEYARTQGDYPSVMRDFFPGRPVVVLRTFSKAYGLAGLRVGYGVGPEDIIKLLDKIRPPFNVSVPSQSAAIAALGDEAFIRKSVKENEKGRIFLAQELEKMGLDVIPSVANFILFGIAPLRGRSIFERLLQKGIIIRALDEYGLPCHLRVTVGSMSENKKFLKVLKEVLEEK